MPGRSPLMDGFGLIAFASLFLMMTVMAYAQIGEWWRASNEKNAVAASSGDRNETEAMRFKLIVVLVEDEKLENVAEGGERGGRNGGHRHQRRPR